MAEAECDRGAFFGSARRAASHLLWADEVWLSRIEGAPIDEGGIAGSVERAPDVATWSASHRGVDARIVAWADALADCEGGITWWSGALRCQEICYKTTI